MQSPITIVSGLPRSGTSLMMQMLDAGGLPLLTDDVRKADADNLRGYYESEPVKRTKDDPSWVAAADGKAVKMVYRLLFDLPASRTYRVIFLMRPLREVLASQRTMLERTKKGGSSLDDKQLEEIFQRELEKIQAWLADRGHFTVHYVAYADLLEESAKQVRKIDNFLGRGLDTDAMQKVIDPKLSRHSLA
jgi:hypothetical protein